jgi:hypothetical protein
MLATLTQRAVINRFDRIDAVRARHVETKTLI